MSISTGGGSTNLTNEPNVTPMIDVMLVLLIIFMAAGPLLAAGFPATPPQGTHLAAHPDDEQDVVLGLDAHGRYYLDKRPVDASELRARLVERLRRRPSDRVVFLRADKGLAYDRVQAAMGIAADAGARVVGLVSEQSPIAGSRRVAVP
jgi:biopolymer transport protein ExbD